MILIRIYRNESKRFKNGKKLLFKNRIIKKIAVGVIVISVSLIGSKYIDYSINDLKSVDDLIFLQQNNTYEDRIVINENILESNIINLKEVEGVNDIDKTNATSSIDEEPTSNNKNVIEKINTDNSITAVQPKDSSLNKDTPKEKEQLKKKVALSYDDGPSKTLTKELLQILKDNNCTATFFVLGCKVNQYSDLIYEMYNAGNEIGNHSYDHSDFTKLTKEQMTKQYQKTSDAIYKITNEYPTFFRPPYGSINNKVKECIESPMALWSVDSNDWRKISDEQVIDNVLSNLSDGDIILMHDIHKRTIEVSKIIIPRIKEEGYDIVSIKKLFETKEVELENGKAYRKCIKK